VASAATASQSTPVASSNVGSQCLPDAEVTETGTSVDVSEIMEEASGIMWLSSEGTQVFPETAELGVSAMAAVDEGTTQTAEIDTSVAFTDPMVDVGAFVKCVCCFFFCFVLFFCKKKSISNHKNH
jgi:hypothetical protein